MYYTTKSQSNYPRVFLPDDPSEDDLDFLLQAVRTDPRLSFCLKLDSNDEESEWIMERYVLKPEVSSWLKSMIKHPWRFDTMSGAIAFADADDAIAFRLAWLHT